MRILGCTRRKIGPRLGLGKGGFWAIAGPGGWWWRKSWRLNDEEWMSAEMEVEGSSGTLTAARMFRAREIHKLGEWRRQVWGRWGWMAANGIKDRYRFKKTEIWSGFLPIISYYAFGKTCFCLLKGWHWGIVIVFCQRGGLLFQPLDVSQRVTVVRK